MRGIFRHVPVLEAASGASSSKRASSFAAFDIRQARSDDLLPKSVAHKVGAPDGGFRLNWAIRTLPNGKVRTEGKPTGTRRNAAKLYTWGSPEVPVRLRCVSLFALAVVGLVSPLKAAAPVGASQTDPPVYKTYAREVVVDVVVTQGTTRR